MSRRNYIDRQATTVATLGRRELTQRIRNFHGSFRLDFTEDYLRRQSVDRLRHILLAALLNCKCRN